MDAWQTTADVSGPGSKKVIDFGIKFEVAPEIQRGVDLYNTARAFEKEVGIDVIFTMIRNGKKIPEIAEMFKMEEDDLLFILTATEQNAKKYAEAKYFHIAMKSNEILDGVSEDKDFSFTRSKAVEHHRKMTSDLLKVVKTEKEDGQQGIVVNNTIVVKSKDDIPPVPDEIASVIDMDVE